MIVNEQANLVLAMTRTKVGIWNLTTGALEFKLADCPEGGEFCHVFVLRLAICFVIYEYFPDMKAMVSSANCWPSKGYASVSTMQNVTLSG